MSAPAPDYREAFLVAVEQCARQKAIIDAQARMLEWALGDGPLPVDEDAERATWGYLRIAVHDFGVRGSMLFFQRTKGLLTTRCPDDFDVPTMPWSEAVRRLRETAELRVAMGRIKEAMRRAAAGNRIGTIRALRGAVDVFGEPKASAPIELQWRVAELENEVRELQAVRELFR